MCVLCIFNVSSVLDLSAIICTCLIHGGLLEPLPAVSGRPWVGLHAPPGVFKAAVFPPVQDSECPLPPLVSCSLC